MSDDLDLSSLSEGPVGVLAPAERVMARGAQRKRRQRVASATAVLVLALGGASLAATADGDSDALQYAPAPTPSATPAADPTLAPPPVDKSGAAMFGAADAEALFGGSYQEKAVTLRTDGPRVAACSRSAFTPKAGYERRVLPQDLGGPGSAYDTASYVLTGTSTQVLEGMASDTRACPTYEEPVNGEKDTYDVTQEGADFLLVHHTRKDCGGCETTEDYGLFVAKGSRMLSLDLLRDSLDDVPRLTDRLRSVLDRVVAFPAETKELTQGAKVWGVYLAVSPKEDDATVAAFRADAERLGYTPSGGQLGCDQGAYQGLGLPDEMYTATAVYFDTQALAQQFVDAYDPGVVGTVRVTVFCAD